MHISDTQQSPNTILTQCSKMTEEGHSRRHAMNGSADGVPKEESPKANYVQGGRLKFFKDGKFILELERAREGERVSWVSVPRKTFWSPQGTAASTPTYRQESSTSLSVSDDNSSIQSSPWQRDHSWKQTTPRRNQSKELIFYFRSPKRRQLRTKSRKRRRPYSTVADVDDPKVLCNDQKNTKDTVCNNLVKRARSNKKPSLQTIVENLLNRHASNNTPPRNELVSPRKRFLREMEKDKVLVDDSYQKRSRNKTPSTTQVATAPTAGVITSTAKTSNSNNTSTAAGSPVRVNGTADEPKPPKNCSYSITSLLADDRTTRRSPSSSPSHYVPMTQPQYCSPNDERWYSDSVDKMRSMDLSQAEKRGYSGYHYHSLPPYPPYLHQYSLSPYYGPNLYGRGYMMPPVYHTPHLQAPIRHNVPTCSWTAEPTSKDADHRDDNITDMPLNLSKHAG